MPLRTQSITSDKFEHIPSGQDEIDLINDDGHVKERLNLAEIDPIFHRSFREMITEAFAEGKHFFVAKVTNKNMNKRESANEQKEIDHSHFFNVYGILKLLFQKKDNQFVGRFHDKYAIVAKNPVTNSVSKQLNLKFLQRIIGEVEFYKISNKLAQDQVVDRG